MTKISFFMVLSLLALISCSESSKKTTNSSSSNNQTDLCVLYPTSGYCTGTTTGTTTSGTTTGTTTTCTGKQYYCISGCAGYTVANAASTYCSGVAETVTNPNYGVKYPGGEPTGSCSTAVAPSTGSGVTYYEPRNARMTIAGGYMADPTSSLAASQVNTDPEFMYLDYNKALFISDAVLKVRFKVNAQPDSAAGTNYCYGRVTGQPTIAGYTKLMYTVTVKGYDASGNLIPRSWTYVTGVNSCSTTLDLSSIRRMYPNGMWMTISNVQGNQGSRPSDYDTKGYTNGSDFMSIRAADCWSLDVQVAGDDTKQF